MKGFYILGAAMMLYWGIYSIYIAVKLRYVGGPFQNSVLMPSGLDHKDCKNPEGYVRYIYPRLMVLGVAIIAYSSFRFVFSLTDLISTNVAVIANVFLFVFIVMFAVIIKKSIKMFW